MESIAQLESSLERGAIKPTELIRQLRLLGRPFSWHPLGFIVCTMIVEGSRKARLHYWPAAQNGRAQSDVGGIHDHIFEFKSWVLAGKVVNREYEISKLGSTYARYDTIYNGNSSIIVKSDERITLAPVGEASYCAGSQYNLQAGRFHQTVSDATSSAVTLLISQDRLSRNPLVLGPENGDARYEYVRSFLTEDEMDALTRQSQSLR